MQFGTVEGVISGEAPVGAIRIEDFRFEPAVLSNQELAFLLDHLEEPPHAALFKGTPPGVNPAQIRKTLGQIHDLAQLAVYQQVPWCGFDAIRDSIMRYLGWDERRREIYRLSGGPHAQQGIAHASQYGWDSTGGAFKYAIGADSAEMPRTEILEDGERRPFGVRMLHPDGEGVTDLSAAAPWIKKIRAAKVTDTLTETRTKTAGALTCSICLRAEQFDPRSRNAYSGARARMGKHLKSAKTEVARHRALYREKFESPSAHA